MKPLPDGRAGPRSAAGDEPPLARQHQTAAVSSHLPAAQNAACRRATQTATVWLEHRAISAQWAICVGDVTKSNTATTLSASPVILCHACSQ